MDSIDIARARAEDIVARARLAGAVAADAVVSDGTSLEVSVRLGALEDVGRSEGMQLGLRVFVGKRNASVSTSDMTPAALDALVERAIAMAREAPEDAWAGLAPADRLLKGQPPQLDLFDPSEPSPEALKERALEAEDAARAVNGVSNSEGAGASYSLGVLALATSHGFSGAYRTSSHGVSASVLAGSGGAMVRDYAYHSARHLARVEAPALVGARAGERTVARLNPGQPESGAKPIVYDPRVSNSLLGHLIGAIAGQSITRKSSFLLHALGTQVFARSVHIRDDPHLPHGLRSRPFDGEGLPVSPVDIVCDGMLETWLLDSASARQLRLEPTGHAARGIGGAPGVSSSNLFLAAGHEPPASLIADIEDGIYVTELIGMGVNGVTGDYSRGAAGFLIEGGKITRPVAEFTIAGNLVDMFRALTPASDLELRYGINAPTLRIDGMTVASG
ncbi:MAG: TldD/PmbA family protein [Sphingomonas sp.]